MRVLIVLIVAMVAVVTITHLNTEAAVQLSFLHGRGIPVPTPKPVLPITKRLYRATRGVCFTYQQHPLTGEVLPEGKKPCRHLKGGGLSWYMNGREI